MAESSTSIPLNEDYESEFEFDPEVGEKRKADRHDLASGPSPAKIIKPSRQSYHDLCAKEQGWAQQQAYISLDAYTRHKKLINDYVLCYQGATEKLKKKAQAKYKTDHDIIKENHRFLWEDEDDASTWGEQLAKKYYDRLFKEYCLCDLTRYKDKKIGMRWRTEKEVVLGKGQFFCGSVHCERREGLESWEVLFGYTEHGEKKNALVKLRLCEKCTGKLHYGYKGKLKKKKEKQQKVVGDEDVDDEETSKKIVEEDSKDESEDGKDVWRRPLKVDEAEPSKEDAFEEFLEDLFL
ncbi:hypothetical protein JTE90_018416 [Oedothorax gibbosus]|uniref:Protein FRA10AC1 n=1 Tax=Oedothorax gibbosus TaxID=931172 RepID=A0AAV6TYW4_9ARAC|nr:hypothetical protein JTE90_018416 [Oedothorax gibbosus]